ncbi:hypothetical protein [Thermoflavimicrobium dichotomicum]|uniref:Uncharacterized protein n=1 Tax=Thermoflavimicrobium dichotomicum TaxID=46223 RepID=A0A1I3UM31_9BACL|nr:hypothetical protein [Thermoflavimicrobium dichotomicum]SFJ82976.1 hypothetical protein SAMN05421852_12532 [Thermoflavimicrobium dichotomicum]
MSEKIKGLTIAFEKDISREEAEFLKAILSMCRGIASVTLKEVSADDWINREQIRYEFKSKILEMIKPEQEK